jgi:2-polyprenyl-3-methyl-5-hydroxy-6-metoxy-1,4-benzoquinol methylase
MDLTTPTFGGEVHPAYANPRDEVTVLIPSAARRVLDVGCSTGEMGAALKARGHHVTGVELDPELAAAARPRLDGLVEGDVESLARDGTVIGDPFDCVVFADVLEHLRDPWAVVRWGAAQVAPGGCLVISVPNVRHAKTFWTLAVRRRWPYDPVGIFDRTHLRFFARRNLPELVAGTGFEVAEVRRHHMLTTVHTSRWNRLARLLGDLGTLQFVVRAERPS